MVIVNLSVWRYMAWICLALFLAACTPYGPGSEDLSNLGLPTETSTGRPTNPAIPPRKIDLPQTPSPEGRADNGEIRDSDTPILGGNQQKAIQAAQSRLSDLLDISIDQIEVVSVKHVEWKTECLGITSPGSMCAQVITPGWVIVLQAEDQEYTFHTDETGSRVRRK